MTDEKPRTQGRPKGSLNKVPAQGRRRVSFSVSCQPEELAELKKLVASSGKTMSRFLLDAVGVST